MANDRQREMTEEQKKAQADRLKQEQQQSEDSNR